MDCQKTLVRNFSVVYFYSDSDLWFTIVPVPGIGRVDNESPHREPSDNPWDDDFASLIPLDCPTSTPVVVSRRLALKTPSPNMTKFIRFGESPPQAQDLSI